MFHYDHGLKLTAIDLAIDFRRRQPRGFVSHAHADHMARHEMAYCTPETALFYQHRLGKRPTKEMPYRQPLEWGPIELTTYPAGHVLGAAMLLANDGKKSLLYTGDFSLEPSLTAATADPPEADILVMECTFGEPQYRWPTREIVKQMLIDRVQAILKQGATPVIHAYVLGKSQEVTKILTTAGIPVLQHPLIFEMSQLYEQVGCRLGDIKQYHDSPLPGCAVIAPPKNQRASQLEGLENSVTIAVTGWAGTAETRRRLQTDYAVPLSDHADYEGLLACVRRVNPQIVYCTHGPESFVGRLRKEGHDARFLGR